MYVLFNKDEQSCTDDVNYIGEFNEECKDWDTKNCSSDGWYLDLLVID